ncbi:MAG: GTPase [Chloroflexota bacterium]
MNEPEDRFDEFVGKWSEGIRRAWARLPDDVRASLLKALGILPADLKQWRGLIDQAVEHLRLAGGGKHQVAIVGPVNVGKSTLYNQLVRSGRDRAVVSAVPGTTRRAQLADAGLFAVIDTPGADAAGPVGEVEKRRALQAAAGADVVLLMFDAAHGVGAAEQVLYRDLLKLGKPLVVALNKIDLVRGERAAVIGRAAEALGLHAEQLIALSAKQGPGVERVLLAVAKSEPGIVAALGAALPAYRWKLAQAAIARAASTAAAIAVTPLPFIDFIPLITVQSALVLGLARIYAYRITMARARELIATFGLGLLGRTLFYELSKLGGPPGWLVAAAVAAGTTVAMGYGAAAWFDRGERLSREQMRRLSRAVSQGLIARLRRLGRRQPKRIVLQEQIGRALEEMPPQAEADRSE